MKRYILSILIIFGIFLLTYLSLGHFSQYVIDSGHWTIPHSNDNRHLLIKAIDDIAQTIIIIFFIYLALRRTLTYFLEERPEIEKK